MKAALQSMFNLKCVVPVRLIIFERELSLEQRCCFSDDSVILESRSDMIQKDNVEIHDM